MSLISRPKGSVSTPNDLTSEAKGAVSTPNSLTSESKGVVSTPNSLTSEAAGSVSIPNNITSQAKGAVATPNSLASEAAGMVATPNQISALGAGQIDPPYCSPTLVLDFAKNIYSELGADNVFSDIITFSRSTTSSYFGREVDQFGNVTFPLKTAAINEPCLAYDPATGESLGLQVFGSATNLLTYSEQLDNAAWIKTNVTVTANQKAGTSGSLTLDSVNDAFSGTASFRVFQSSGASITGDVKTMSLTVAKGKAQFIRISSDTGLSARFDLDLSEPVGVIDADSVSIKKTISGLYLITCTWTATFDDTNVNVFMSAVDNSSSISYTGVNDGAALFYAGEVQVETGSIATPYIKTEASQVTRAADLASVNDLSGWYNQTQGSVFVDTYWGYDNGGNRVLFAVGDGTASNNYYISSNASNKMQTAGFTNGVNEGELVSNYDANEGAMSALSYSTSRILTVGSVSYTDTSYNAPASTRLDIGKFYTGGIPLQGHIKTLSYYPTALSAQKLQELTR